MLLPLLRVSFRIDFFFLYNLAECTPNGVGKRGVLCMAQSRYDLVLLSFAEPSW